MKLICLFSLIALLAGHSCNLPQGAPFEEALDEIERVRSPDGKVYAVLVETGGGATTALGSAVIITSSTKKLPHSKLEYAVFTADHSSKIDISWKANKQLQISFEKARIFRFTNFWETEELENWNYVVEINLLCLSADGPLTEHDKRPVSQ